LVDHSSIPRASGGAAALNLATSSHLLLRIPAAVAAAAVEADVIFMDLDNMGFDLFDRGD
jgi:hypothetical protein